MSNYPTPTEHDRAQAHSLLLTRKRSAISIQPETAPTSPDAPYPSSYFGGLPFLPEGIAWPRLRDGEMNFISQITLSDLPAVPNSSLPPKGRLLFFTRTDFDNDFGPKDCAVIFDTAPQSGQPSSPPTTLRPLGDSERRQRLPNMHPGVELRYGIRFAATGSYPNWHDIERHPVHKRYHVANGKAIEIEDDASVPTGDVIVEVVADEGISGVEMAFHDVLEQLEDQARDSAWPDESVRSIHQILGYGINIQDEGRANEDNVLLLQLYAAPFADGWLSDGALNFWISPDNLRKRDFRQVFTTAEWT